MFVQTRIQSTPNPKARKYVLNCPVKGDGKVSYKDLSECGHVPLAQALLSIPGVVQVHFFENVITVTQNGSTDWQQLDQGVQGIVQEKIGEHDIHFVDFLSSETSDKVPSPELEAIDAILDHTIRPALQNDGGDIETIEYDGNVLTMRYLGACGGCPSSMMGTLEAVKDILRTEYRPDIEVVVV
jgi:Fe-S cluster biogenesis protein NfuA